MSDPTGPEAPMPAGPEPPADAGEQARRTALARLKEAVVAGQSRVGAVLERHRHRPLVDLALRFFERDRESAGTVVGSAIAFRLFLFFVPLLLLVVGLAGFVVDYVDDSPTDSAGISGGLARQINEALAQPTSTRWLAVLVGLFGMATTGRSLTKVMVAAGCLAWRMPVQAKASVRLIGAMVGLISTLGLVSILVNRVRLDSGVAVAGASYLMALGIYAVAWIVISLLLPRATTDPGALLPGAVVVAATIVGMQALSQLVLPDRFERASALYGAIGTTIVTLGWFFIIGRAIVLSMALDAVIWERFGSISQVVFSLPVLRILPRRSQRLRHFFGLDRPAPGEESKPGPS